MLLVYRPADSLADDFGLSLQQLCEADDAYAERVLPAMHRFIKLMHHMLENGGQGYVSWGRARSHDMTITLQWLYENHPMDNGPMLLDTMKLLTDGAFDWSYFFSKDVFPVDDVDDIPDLDLPYDFQHVVNLAQGQWPWPSLPARCPNAHSYSHRSPQSCCRYPPLHPQ